MVDPSKIAGSRVNPVPRTGTPGRVGQPPASDRSFDEVFDSKLKEEILVSRHAAARMHRDGIHIDSAQSDRLGRALDEVEDRGGKTSLVLLDDLAMVVNVRQRTLVTVVSGERRGGGVFTDIDSAVIAD